MKVKKQGIIKNISKSVTVKRIFLQIFVIHFLFVHFIFQSYILCIESDGQIVLENAAETEYCCNTSILLADGPEMESNVDEECSLCKDIAFSENCEEKYSVTVNKYQLINTSISVNLTNQNIRSEENKSTFISQEINIKSVPLNSYKSVLLLI